MRDLPRSVSIGVPLASLLLCAAIALVGPDVYFRLIAASERGYLEHSTVTMLLPAIAMAAWLAFRSRRFPRPLLSAWAGILCIGAIYYAGEEASWGQHYFGWKTPEPWTEVNDQGETNIHNTHGVFDQTPRGALTLAALLAVLLPLTMRRQAEWDPRRNWREWVVPTSACIPSALLVVTVGLPQKLYATYTAARDPNIPAWFDSMFLRGWHSELKEHFIAMFILMYVASWFCRIRSLDATRIADAPAREDDEGAQSRRAA